MFLSPEDKTWCEVRDYFGFADSFPAHLLYRRNNTDERVALFHVNSLTHRIVTAGVSAGLKLVSAGVRILSRVAVKHAEGGLRLVTEGLKLVAPHMRDQRAVTVTAEEAVRMLRQPAMQISELHEAARVALQAMEVGTVLVRVLDVHVPAEHSGGRPRTLPTMFAGWRSHYALQLHITKADRVALQGLCLGQWAEELLLKQMQPGAGGKRKADADGSGAAEEEDAASAGDDVEGAASEEDDDGAPSAAGACD
jgi:hypothetical protein